MTTLRLRHAFAGALAVCLLALTATDAHATHFRYGTMRWEVIPTVPPGTPGQTRIKVTSESAWRRTFSWPGGATPTLGVPLNTGQTLMVQNITTSGVVGSAALSVTPSSINEPEDWFVGSTLLEFQFATSNLPVRIFYQGNARVSNLADNNADDSFRVESVMSATPNAASPAASILPIITVGYPSPAAHFFIPAADVEGDTMTWSIAPTTRSLLTKAAPDGVDDIPPPTLSINPLTGEVTWATDQERSPLDPQGPIFSEFYSVQFIVTDSKGAQTPVDAFLRVRQIIPNPPEALINDSPNQHLVSVRPNNPVTFTLRGVDNDAGATVTLTSGNLPPGATMTPSLPTVGPGATPGTSSAFNWTPTFAQAGNSYTVPFAVTDEFGNQDTNSAVITVLVNFPPTITCPAERTAEATGPAGADNVTLDATVGDQDPDALTVRWFVDGTLVETDTVPASPPGPTQAQVSLTRSYAFLPSPHAIRVEVTDGQATRECPSTVTVVDTTPPVVTVPGTITVEVTNPSGEIVTFTASALDIVDGNVTPVTCTPASGSTFLLGDTLVTCTATDAHGNTGTASFHVIVQDTTAPVVTVPSTVWEATSPAGAVATFIATAVDLFDGNVTPVTCTPPSGSTFPLGITTVVCTATDSHGNVGSGSGTVRVQDTTPPVITNNPGKLVREATNPGGAPVTWPALIATDIADPNVPVTCVPASGSMFAINPPGPVTAVLCTATDDSGNSSTATFDVRVVDTTPPAFTNVPGPITVPAVGTGAFVTYTPPTATDLVDLNRPVACVPPSGSFFPIGTTTVTCTASDTRGNVGTATFTVTVTNGDTKPPKVCLKLSPGTLWPPNHRMRPIRVILTVRDNQDPTPTCAITEVISSEPVTGRTWGNTTPDWIFSGLNLQLRAERYSQHGRTYTVTVLCSDDAGNTTTTRGIVRVPHDQGDGGHGGGHDLLGGGNDNNDRGNQSGACCVRRNDRDRDHDDDDNFTWTNDLTKKGENDHDRCFDEDDDDDDDLTTRTDATKAN